MPFVPQSCTGAAYAAPVGPLNRYSLVATLAVVALGVLLRPGLLVVLGLAALALALHFYLWDPDRSEVFADDWVEIGVVYLIAFFFVIGTGLLGVGLIV